MSTLFVPADSVDGASLRSIPRRQTAVALGAATLGALVFMVSLKWLTNNEPTTHQFLVTGSAFLAAAVSPGMRLQHGREATRYKFWEYGLLTGLACGAPVLAVVMLSIFHAPLLVRQGLTNFPSRLKAAVEGGAMTVGGALGVGLATLGGPWFYPLGCVLVFVITNGSLIAYDRTRGVGRSGREWFDLARPALVAIALSTLLTVWLNGWGKQSELILLTPGAVLLLYWVLQSRSDMLAEKAAWERMEAVSDRFASETNASNIVPLALQQALALFDTSEAIFVRFADTSRDTPLRFSLHKNSNQVKVEPVTDIRELEIPQPQTAREMVMAMRAGARTYGYMRLGWHQLGPDEQFRRSIASTFNHAVAASLATATSTRLLREQAAIKTIEAERDPLTKIGNRTHLATLAPIKLNDCTDVQVRAALLMFDLDNFKRINDTLGHAVGDEVLVQVSERLKRTVRHSDLIIRLGGDEFAVLATDFAEPEDAERVAQKIIAALTPPVSTGDIELSVQASIGIAVFPDDAGDVNTLMKLADIAMYRSKAMGRGIATRYSKQLSENTRDALYLSSELGRALQSKEGLVLHYQPQVDMLTSKPTGVEALVRWEHPTRGLIYPDEFVHLAEQSNMIRPFTLQVLDMALAARVEMRKALPNGTMSVNLSAHDLLDAKFPHHLRNLLIKHRVSPEELVLEITETSATNDVKAFDSVVRSLTKMGCVMAVDDFGTGYASLESLRPGTVISEVKVDRAFVREIAVNPRDRTVTAAIISIARAWDCRVVAEGIEDRETFLLLKEMGCDIGQGYFWKRPLPLDELLEWLPDPTSGLGVDPEAAEQVTRKLSE